MTTYADRFIPKENPCAEIKLPSGGFTQIEELTIIHPVIKKHEDEVLEYLKDKYPEEFV